MKNVMMRGTVLALSLGILGGCSTMGSYNLETACVLGGAAVGGGIGATNDSEDAVKGAIGGALVGALACHLMDGDSDSDGVKDSKDQCEATPLGKFVDENGCSIVPVIKVPVDADMDGIADTDDLCLDTPAGVEVNADGCTMMVDIVLDGINFDSSSSSLSVVADEVLLAQVELLRMNPALRISLVGHTDSTGPEAFNQTLSVARAMAVRDFFVSEGVDASIFTVSGAGEMEPAVNNSTAEGRAANRRVELKVISQEI